MDIEDMNDFEIRAVLEKRQKQREEAAKQHQLKMSEFMAMLCDTINYRDIVLDEAKQQLTKSDYEWLIGDTKSRMYDFNITISFSPTRR